ncbi:MAG: hypothetical protein MK106_13625 [Mariniblastus sp.]|nr:hypothetical protein [Mariniblastus sp.]
MHGSEDQIIVNGIHLSPSGEATVSATVTQSLIDLAIFMEEHSRFPLDVEHVLAGIIMARREGRLPATTQLCSDNAQLIEVLTPLVDRIFQETGGNITKDD